MIQTFHLQSTISLLHKLRSTFNKHLADELLIHINNPNTKYIIAKNKLVYILTAHPKALLFANKDNNSIARIYDYPTFAMEEEYNPNLHPSRFSTLEVLIDNKKLLIPTTTLLSFCSEMLITEQLSLGQFLLQSNWLNSSVNQEIQNYLLL